MAIPPTSIHKLFCYGESIGSHYPSPFNINRTRHRFNYVATKIISRADAIVPTDLADRSLPSSIESGLFARVLFTPDGCQDFIHAIGIRIRLGRDVLTIFPLYGLLND